MYKLMNNVFSQFMVDGLRGVSGVYVRRHVERLFEQEHERVLIQSQEIMDDYALDPNERKNHVRKSCAQVNQHD